jgi:hypothetical protein
LHQDKNEWDLRAPIVSVSLGMRIVFLFGGHQRSDKTGKILLCHGDVLVWGGEDRLRYHGVQPLKNLPHPRTGSLRFNLTFRKAGHCRRWPVRCQRSMARAFCRSAKRACARWARPSCARPSGNRLVSKAATKPRTSMISATV